MAAVPGPPQPRRERLRTCSSDSGCDVTMEQDCSLRSGPIMGRNIIV